MCYIQTKFQNPKPTALQVDPLENSIFHIFGERENLKLESNCGSK